MTDISAETLQGIAFVGRTLGPFYRYDPRRLFQLYTCLLKPVKRVDTANIRCYDFRRIYPFFRRG